MLEDWAKAHPCLSSLSLISYMYKWEQLLGKEKGFSYAASRTGLGMTLLLGFCGSSLNECVFGLGNLVTWKFHIKLAPGKRSGLEYRSATKNDHYLLVIAKLAII